MTSAVRSKTGLWAVAVATFFLPLAGGSLILDAFPLNSSRLIADFPHFQSAPALAHCLLALPFVLVLAINLWRERVVPVASHKIFFAFLTFFLILTCSIASSQHQWITIQSVLEWIGYGVVFGGVLVAVGRQKGPSIVLSALALGGFLVAIIGVREYADMRAIDPTWRIFAGWINQNALAGILNLCIFCALGLSLISERVHRIGWVLVASVSLFALLLSQSRGGILSFFVGFLVLVVFACAWGGVRRALPLVAPLIIMAALAGGLQASAKKTAAGSGSTAMTRLGAAGETQEHSAGFRKLLWQSSIELAKSYPTGRGMNTFQFESARPGLVAPTKLAHSTYLQLAAEASPLALLAFVVMGAYWFVEMIRGSRSFPVEANLLRAGILGAIVATIVHNQLDSLMYHFGIGAATFALLATGLLLAADGSGPELMPQGIRRVASCFVALVGVGLILSASNEWRKGTAIANEDLNAMAEQLTAAESSFPLDAEVSYLLGNTLARKGDISGSIQSLERAAKLSPSARYQRKLAQAYLAQNRPDRAVLALKSALSNDSLNLSALELLRQAYIQSGSLEEAKETAIRAIAVEETPRYKVRALPEIVETQTADARVYLASIETDPEARILLYRKAVEIYGAYAQTTVPRIPKPTEDNPGASFGGQTTESARRILAQGQDALKMLMDLYRAVGKPDRIGELEPIRLALEANL